MVRLIKQRGFLLVAAIAMVVVAGFYGVVFTHMLTSGTSSNINYIQAMQSYYIADGGLNRGLYAVNAANVQDSPDPLTTVDVRMSCSTIGTTALGTGEFNINVATRKTTRTTLSAALSNSSSNILITSTNDLTSQGRVYIGQEAVDYKGLGTCGPTNVPCLINATRGANSTVASSHDNGIYVSQFACELTATGSVPSLASPSGSSTLSAATNMEAVFAAGVDSGSSMTFTHWNSINNNAFTQANSDNSTAGNNNDIYGIAAAGPDYLLAVGKENDDDIFTLWQWDVTNSKWIQLSQPSVDQNNYRQDLNAISAVSEKEAWAVGDRGGSGGSRRWTVLRWDGSSWCAMTPSGACDGKDIPSDGGGGSIKHLEGVSVIDTNGDGLGNFGFAVGNSGKILEYDGTDWTTASSPTSTTIRSVFVVSANEAWACGDSGKIYRWDGSSWSQVRDFGGQQLYSVTALDTTGDGYANVGWVVGRQNNNGRAYRFTQATPGATLSWTTHNPSGGANKRLRGVTMRRIGDVWAVGNTGRTIHWNGTTWTQITSDVSKNLFAVTMIGPREPKGQAFTETFN